MNFYFSQHEHPFDEAGPTRSTAQGVGGFQIYVRFIQLLTQIPPLCLLYRPCLHIVFVCCVLFLFRCVFSVAWSLGRAQNQGSGVQKRETFVKIRGRLSKSAKH